ncbi:hypothetical protein LZ32DRAFT_619748 [Colletotrichum eremochloae]|nr:hypothetical protein LZ32DRAFT_619748 [Colletotrichum eremochloae]
MEYPDQPVEPVSTATKAALADAYSVALPTEPHADFASLVVDCVVACRQERGDLAERDYKTPATTTAFTISNITPDLKDPSDVSDGPKKNKGLRMRRDCGVGALADGYR